MCGYTTPETSQTVQDVLRKFQQASSGNVHSLSFGLNTVTWTFTKAQHSTAFPRVPQSASRMHSLFTPRVQCILFCPGNTEREAVLSLPHDLSDSPPSWGLQNEVTLRLQTVISAVNFHFKLCKGCHKTSPKPCAETRSSPATAYSKDIQADSSLNLSTLTYSTVQKSKDGELSFGEEKVCSVLSCENKGGGKVFGRAHTKIQRMIVFLLYIHLFRWSS